MATLAERVLICLAIVAGLAWAHARAGTVGDPFNGAPIQINGTPGAVTLIEAENFDKGGEGIAYHDPHSCGAPPAGTTCSCPPGAYRPDGVNVCTTGAVTHISYDDDGLWVSYTVQVSASAAYTIELLAAQQSTVTPAYHLEVDGWRYPQDATRSYSVPATSGWQTYAWGAKSEAFALSPGRHTLRIVLDHGWFNWDAIRVKYVQDATVIWNGYAWVPVFRTFP